MSVFVDSNVFVIALRYPRDRDARANARFLEHVAENRSGVTTVVNVLEVCGILSFNLNERQMRGLYAHFARRFSVRVVPAGSERSVMPARPSEVLASMSAKMAFGDALVAIALQRWVPDCQSFVSWNAKHFRGKIPTPALTPRQFLESHV
jgi:predicted nucleic acid-binding protein